MTRARSPVASRRSRAACGRAETRRSPAGSRAEHFSFAMNSTTDIGTEWIPPPRGDPHNVHWMFACRVLARAIGSQTSRGHREGRRVAFEDDEMFGWRAGV